MTPERLQQFRLFSQESLPSFSTEQLAYRAHVRELVEALEAEAQALADVRTLDDWAEADCGTREWKMLPTNEDTCVCLRSGMSSEIVCFERGATPDEARAAAAKWVREQKR